ncbi:MAG: hypothetical protein U1E65_07330 [Myxococcota bacterium]
MEAEFKRIQKRAIPGAKNVDPKRAGEQTLIYPFSAELAWAAMHYLRTPSRTIWGLFETTAMRLEPLYDELRDLVAADRRGWLRDGMGISVYERESQNFPAGPMQIMGTVKNAIIDAAAERQMVVELDPERPDLLISARGAPLSIGVDLFGGSMHERGYRLSQGEAPLRETVAAQMLMLSRWDPRRELLYDPMCGAGTIPIEAAMMATGAPLLRAPKSPLGASLPVFSGLNRAVEALFPGTPPPILGSDRDPEAVLRAKDNAHRAGAREATHFFEAAIENVERATLEAEAARAWPGAALEGGLLIANPPYGVRLEGEDDAALIALYEALRALVVRLGFRSAFIVDHPDFERVMGWRPVLKKPIPNGKLRAYLYVYDRS